MKEKYRERYAGHQNRNKSNISDYISQGGGVSEVDNLDYSEIIREANTMIDNSPSQKGNRGGSRGLEEYKDQSRSEKN